jgi:aspartyl-tRNA(Asn)/glutamyl-tRNA(Gln) amidotransferase subunit A
VNPEATPRVETALRLAHATQKTLNAFTFIDDTAIDRARELDESGGSNDEPGALFGVPVGLKDLIDQAGRVTTAGSAFYRHHADRSATVVNRLEAADAVIIGRTGLHEWAFGFSSENPHFGPVRNPWNLDTSVGGSSGGTAAAVAAGITPLGVGTDTGGSVRVPAALCGCFGLKTTHGAIPLDGVFPLVTSIDTVGPLADGMANIELGYRVMADDWRPLPETPDRLRLGIPHPIFDDAPMDSETTAHFEAALAALRDRGHEVVDVEAQLLTPPGQIWEAIAEEVIAVHRQFLAEGRTYGEDVAVRLADAARVGRDETAAALAWQRDLRDETSRLFTEVDYLVTPTVPAMRKTIGEDMIGGHHYRKVLSWFTAIVNHTLCPALVVPLTADGAPPPSLQIIGPSASDLALVAVGRRLESDGFAGFRPAPARAS